MKICCAWIAKSRWLSGPRKWRLILLLLGCLVMLEWSGVIGSVCGLGFWGVVGFCGLELGWGWGRLLRLRLGVGFGIGFGVGVGIGIGFGFGGAIRLLRLRIDTLTIVPFLWTGRSELLARWLASHSRLRVTSKSAVWHFSLRSRSRQQSLYSVVLGSIPDWRFSTRGSSDRNRTCICTFGGCRVIHYTTEPFKLLFFYFRSELLSKVASCC